MSLLNITCPICTEVFNNADDVYSTSCGHLFHYVCMTDWQSRNTSCPQCRQPNPTTHKLYLSFDESDDILINIEEMKQKLKSSLEKITELQVQNSELEVNFMELQDQYTMVDNERRQLEENIKQMNDSEEHFMQLQGQYTESAEHVKDLEGRILQLSIDNECKSKELQLTIAQNESLKTTQDVNQSAVPDSILKQRLQILELKLNNISRELEKEINTSTQLSIEKMKLESIIKNCNALDKDKQKTNEHNSKKQNFRQNRKNKKENKNPASPLSQNQAESRNRCIIIKDLTSDMIVTPLELVVINLASKVRMNISAYDLLKVNFVDEARTKLFAEFRSSNLKETFLYKKIFLKTDPLTENLRIREFMHENVYELYKYAKEKLKDNGFISVFCANNQIFAKKFKEQRHGLQIKSKQQVDKLYIENTNNETTDSTEKSKDGATVDEN